MNKDSVTFLGCLLQFFFTAGYSFSQDPVGVEKGWNEEKTKALKEANKLREMAISLKDRYPDSALIYFNKSLEISLENNMINSTAAGYYNLGAFHSEHGDQLEALRHTDSALYYYVKINAKTSLSGIYSLKGAAYTSLGNYEKASEMYFKSINLMDTVNNRKGYLLILSNLVFTYNDMNRPEEALKHAMNFYRIAHAMNDRDEIGYACIAILDCYSRLETQGAGRKYLDELVVISGKSEDEYMVVLTALQLGNLALFEGRNSDAVSHLQNADRLSEGMIDPVVQCMIYNSLATALIRLKKHDLAYHYVMKARKISEETDQANQRRTTYQILQEVLAKMQKFEEAFKYGLLEKKLTDSLLNRQVHIAISNAEAKFENNKKQAEINVLNLEAEGQARERRLVYIIGGLVLLFLAGTFYSYRQQQSIKLIRQKEESQRKLQEEKDHIGRELHDDLGSRLSAAKLFLNDFKKNMGKQNGTELLDNSLAILETSIKDLRVVMDDLRQSTLKDQGYLAATEELVRRINQNNQIKFALSHHGISRRLPQQMEHHLYRITQELINNTLKYAGATKVTIDIVLQPEKIVLTYEDDGKGFDMAEITKGYGLSNIESRIKSLDGYVDLNSSPGRGVVAILEIPFISTAGS